MDKCDSCKVDDRQVYCKNCDQSICLHCNRSRHFDTITDHSFHMMCEECERDVRAIYCQSCEQSFCVACDQNIHRKGTRVHHMRIQVSKEEDFKVLLNYLYMPGNISEFDLKQVAGYTVERNIHRMSQHTVVQYYGEKSSRLADFLGQHGFMNEQVSKINPATLVDYFVRKFDKSVFLNEVVFLTKEAVPEDVKRSFEELFPSVKIKCILIASSNDRDMSHVTEENKSTNQKSEAGNQPLQSYSYKAGLAKNDSKDPTNDNIADTLNSGSGSVLRRHYSSSVTQSRMEHIRTPGAIPSQQTNLLSKIFSQKLLADLSSIGATTLDYLEFYFGLRELRHASSAMKQLLGKSSSQLPLVHLFNDINTDGLITPQLSLKVQEMLKSFAEDGEILVDYNQLLDQIVKSEIASEEESRNILLRMADLSIIIINCRQVTQSHSLNLVSLKLEFLTLENLYWVVKSLALDKLTPTEDIVMARVKEAYGLKMKTKIWSKVIEHYSALLANKNSAQPQTLQLDSHDLEFFELSIEKKESPNGNNQPTVVFDIKSLGIQYEDAQDIQDSDSDWLFFKQYINTIFEEGREDLLFYNNISTNAEVKKVNHNLDKPIYAQDSSSNLNFNSSFIEHQDAVETSKLEHNSSITEGSQFQGPLFKAISGGRYGMAQFVKYFGPFRLKSLSIGRLSKLVQKAIDLNLLVYYKTFILKKTETQNDSQKEVKRKSRSYKEENNLIMKFKQVLIESVYEMNNCLPLAQLSDTVSKKLDFKFDFREYGFDKLTQFIETFCSLP